jgi:site-specific DNA recombinase
MGITYTAKKGRQYRYYMCIMADKRGYDTCPVKSVSAAKVEAAVIDQLRAIFRSPAMSAEVLRAARFKEHQHCQQLASERAQLEQQLGVQKANASRLLGEISKGGNGHGNSHGHGLISEELARLNTDIEEAEKGLGMVNGELALFSEQPVGEGEIAKELGTLDSLWAELFPMEQERIVKLLVERVDVSNDALEIHLHSDGLASVLSELQRETATGATGEQGREYS